MLFALTRRLRRTAKLLRQDESKSELAPRSRRGQRADAQREDPARRSAAAGRSRGGGGGPEGVEGGLQAREEGRGADVVQGTVEGFGEGVRPAE